jgi:hypothetical protein
MRAEEAKSGLRIYITRMDADRYGEKYRDDNLALPGAVVEKVFNETKQDYQKFKTLEEFDALLKALEKNRKIHFKVQISESAADRFQYFTSALLPPLAI